MKAELRLRRKEREISNRSLIDEIIHGSKVCHLGLAINNEPYVVPLSFGYDGSSLYFHTAMNGQKIDFIESNPRICFEMIRSHSVLTDEAIACKWTASYESVIGYGLMHELVSPEDKIHGLNQIMIHYSDREWEFQSAVVSRTRVWRLDVESVTSKRSSILS